MTENKLIKAYDDLMTHLYEAMDDTLHTIADALVLAKKKTHELGSHSIEDINKIADFVMRDIQHAAKTTENKSHDNLTEWLKFDIHLLENFAVKAFLDLADKTRIELAALEIDAKQYHPYTSGDVASPGTFICDECQKQISFKSTSIIPVCPNCQSKRFTRC